MRQFQSSPGSAPPTRHSGVGSFALVALANLLLCVSPAAGTIDTFGITISASHEDPYVHFAPATGDLDTLYLWIVCCPDTAHGQTALETGLVADGIQLLELKRYGCGKELLIPKVFPPDVLVAWGGCHCAVFCPFARLLIVNHPGTVCLGPSEATGTIGAVSCSHNPALIPLDWVGFTSEAGGVPCTSGALCNDPISVESRSWGRLKSLYR